MRIVLSKEAADYLRHERVYLERFNPRAADATLRQLRGGLRLLAAHPNAGSALLPLPGRRRFVVGDYVIDYRVERGAVEVAHIRHGRQQSPELPKGNATDGEGE